MIELRHHDPQYIALRNCYQHRAAIKALGDYPDVQWHPATQAWLVDNRLWDDLVAVLGKWFGPAPVSFWMEFTPYTPPASTPRRRSKRQIMTQKRIEQQAASRYGQAYVDQMHRKDK